MLVLNKRFDQTVELPVISDAMMVIVTSLQWDQQIGLNFCLSNE